MTIVAWDGDLHNIENMVRHAMELLPGRRAAGHPRVVSGSFEYDPEAFCFLVVVEAGTNTVARTRAYTGLHEALLAAGIGIGPKRQQWTPLVLDPDPAPLRLRPLDGRTLLGQLSTS